MLRSVTLFCVLAVCAYGFENPRSIQIKRDRIFGGQPIQIRTAPFQVSIQKLGEHVCGGSIISKLHVLTAAHCAVVEPNVKNLAIGSASKSWKELNIHKVVKSVHHKLFDPQTMDYDVAVLKVPENEPFSLMYERRAPIRIMNFAYKVADNEFVNAYGWGVTKSDDPTNVRLMAVRSDIVNFSACEKAFSGKGFKLSVTPRMICAVTKDGIHVQEVCHSEGGSPLVSKYTGAQIGISSWGAGCNQPSQLSVYTNILNKEIHNFITEEMKK